MRQVLIVFPDEWVSYSPTVLNLAQLLKEKFRVRVIGFESRSFDNKYLDNDIFRLCRVPPFLCNRIFSNKFVNLTRIYKLINMYMRIFVKYRKSDIVIGVDSLGCLVSQMAFKKGYYLSLELVNDIYFRLLKIDKIEALLIQTEERKRYLFKEKFVKTIYMQNSPILDSEVLFPDKNLEVNKKIIYLGNICFNHAIIQCIEVVKEMPNVQLELKGIIKDKVQTILYQKYKMLFDTKKVIIDTNYLPQEQVISYLRKYAAGFCLYDFEIIQKNDFNYLSCPSGKLFNYYAAGVPVVATSMFGLQSVNDFKAGILIEEHTTGKIRDALYRIFDNHPVYVKNCYKAAAYFDFKIAYNRFLELID